MLSILKLFSRRQTSLNDLQILPFPFPDNEPCVTGSNIDGYIPMRFQSGTTIHITGKPSLTIV